MTYTLKNPWDNWIIMAEDHVCFNSLTIYPNVPIKRENDIKVEGDSKCLYGLIKKNPSYAVRVEPINKFISRLREESLVSFEAKKKYDKIDKAIRKYNASMRDIPKLEGLKKTAEKDLLFFKKIHDESQNESVDQRINDFLGVKRIVEHKNYETKYYDYKKIYTQLDTSGLTKNEIYSFFECAIGNLDKLNHIFSPYSEKRTIYEELKRGGMTEEDIKSFLDVQPLNLDEEFIAKKGPKMLLFVKITDFDSAGIIFKKISEYTQGYLPFGLPLS